MGARLGRKSVKGLPLLRGRLIRSLTLRRHPVSLQSSFSVVQPGRVIHIVRDRVVSNAFEVSKFRAYLCSGYRSVGLGKRSYWRRGEQRERGRKDNLFHRTPMRAVFGRYGKDPKEYSCRNIVSYP